MRISVISPPKANPSGLPSPIVMGSVPVSESNTDVGISNKYTMGSFGSIGPVSNGTERRKVMLSE